MAPRVVFSKCDYDRSALGKRVPAMLEQAGGLRIRTGTRVLIKPNFLAPARPERAMTTHPLVLRAAAEYALDCGSRVLIADSPGMGSFDRLLREGGYADALRGLEVAARPFKESVAVDIGQPFGRIEIAREAIEAEVVINLPKLKTHAQMLLTLGVKNLFGCIVGYKKPEWHMRSGVDRQLFARLLVLIHRAVDPAVTLVDGIVGMEGHGPGRSGTPRPFGVLAAGASAPAVDAAICRFLNLPPERLPTHRAAAELGLAPQELEISGDFLPVPGVRLPVLAPLTFGPRRMQRLMRKHLVQRPEADPRLCRMCGECWRVCPAKAITAYARQIGFDYDRCIRCYCCVEMCPHGALKAAETGPGRIVRKLAGLRDHLAVRLEKRRR
ncbi:MAG: DUF362 domain-containing protein [Desulfobacterales bacterium]|jgi:uncharacterized protein (DUF362 family)/Pyruvate/2-oxoacid:ferredoxin oxidoreductase delta subunit|nr:DUF362 domain-containing protein [Desulfobacterales bacterium]